MKLRNRLATSALALSAFAFASLSMAQELRIGFMATQTGGAAAIGQHAVNGWKIGLEHEGWTKDGDKIAGVPLRMFYADDQLKPDVALKEIERLISQERIHIGAGFVAYHRNSTAKNGAYSAVLACARTARCSGSTGLTS